MVLRAAVSSDDIDDTLGSAAMLRMALTADHLRDKAYQVRSDVIVAQGRF